MNQRTFDYLKSEFEEAVKSGEVNASRHSPAALKWFYDFIRRNITSMHALEGLTSGRSATIEPGAFYVYSYDPKYKDTLPYYDTIPLILCTKVTPKGWYGINFHYLPPKVRLEIVKEMYSIMKSGASDGIKFKLSWQKAVQLGTAIGKMKWFNHAIKQYLFSHVKSKLIKVSGDNIEPMIFLPIARFKKMTQEEVWRSA